MDLILKIRKKDFWLFSSIIVFLIGVGVVIAYGSGDPSLNGHDAGEIMVNIDGSSISLQEAIDSGSLINSNYQVDSSIQVNGSIIGGGSISYSGSYTCSNWGAGICPSMYSNDLICPANSSKRQTGYYVYSDSWGSTHSTKYYICVKD